MLAAGVDPHPASASLADVWPVSELDRRQPLLTATGLMMLVVMLPLGVAALLDERTLIGVSVWNKPLKFAFAFGVYALTLAFFTGWVEGAARRGAWFRAAIVATCVSIAAEQAYICFQAARGLGSHFNVAEPFHAAMYAMMGIGALILTAAAPVVGWRIARHPATGLSPTLRDGAVTGLFLTLPLTLLTAGTMSAMGGHWVGGVPSDAGGLFPMGWARDGGDLRVPHFFGTHAMHAVPLFAVLSLRLAGSRRWPVFAFAALYAVLTLALFAEALAGKPFLPFLI